MSMYLIRSQCRALDLTKSYSSFQQHRSVIADVAEGWQKAHWLFLGKRK